jgi:DNA polymerase III epsilon subunit-like protein
MTQHYVFFDCETTGLPRNYKVPATDTGNWPRVIQLAWLVTDPAGVEEESGAHLIQPQGFTIPSNATKIHGITTEKARRDGIQLDTVLELFAKPLSLPEVVLVAHNFSFDFGCVGAEFFRKQGKNPLDGLPSICTMKVSTDVCRIPGPYGYKWPNLAELHFYLFKERLQEAHEALADVRTCARCFFELKNRGIIRGR